MRQDGNIYTWTLVYGLPLMAVLWWAVRSRIRASSRTRIWLCVLTALVITPTVLSPYGKWNIYPLWFPFASAIVGFLHPGGALLFGVLPLIFVAGIFHGILGYICRRTI